MGKNVMVVDDAAFMRMKIVKLLQDNGYNVVGEAGNGEEAVLKYSQLKPDLVIMDITMPVMDGIAAINEIKKNDDAAKVIVCSAMGQQNMVIQAIKSGAKDYVLKPFQPDRVLEAIKKQIG
ncbi:MAG: response regulator [Rubrobacteridae bacterium]|nr:response regulator [Rubrobacteridae bacterium]